MRYLPVALVLLLTVVGRWLAPHPTDRPVTFPFAPPSAQARLGGDQLGRDVLSRLLCGGADLLALSVAMAVIVTTLAAGLGTLAAVRPRVGVVIERCADLLILLPAVLATLIVLCRWPQLGMAGLILIAVLLGTPYSARVFAAAAAPIAASGYVEVAAARGERVGYLVFREILPNLRETVLTQLGLRFVVAFSVVGAAAFLQLPTGVGDPNWATTVRECVGAGMQLNPWSVLAPCLAIVVVVLAVQRALTVPAGVR